MKNVTSLTELKNLLSTAKCGGQFVSVTYETKVTLRVNPTDGSNVGKREKNFAPTKRAKVTYHFAEDYDKKMSKILGEDYKANDDNREHLVHNVLMRYISTNNVCLIAMPSNTTKLGYFLNGIELTKEQRELMNHYLPNVSSKPIVQYRTIGVLNVIEIAINKEVYQVKIASL